jgi:polyisoprenoid-binding protein YceI
VVLLLTAGFFAPCLDNHAQANPARSIITVHVHKTGLFSAFAHDHVITAPVGLGVLDPKAMTVEIRVSTKQMKVVDPDVSDKDRMEIQTTMLGPKVLDAEKYPEIRFQSSHVEQIAARRYRVTGKLELHGSRRDLSFEVNGRTDSASPARAGFARDGVADRYQGKTKLKQTDFGIEPVSIAGGTIKVKDEVEVEFDVNPTELATSKR